VGERHAELAVHVLDEAGAVEAGRRIGTAPHIDAEELLGERDCPFARVCRFRARTAAG
jgi:hypothetical protein